MRLSNLKSQIGKLTVCAGVALLAQVCCGQVAGPPGLPGVLTNQAGNLTNYELVTNVCWRPIPRFITNMVEWWSATNGAPNPTNAYSIRETTNFVWWRGADVVSFNAWPSTNHPGYWFCRGLVRENAADNYWFYAVTPQFYSVTVAPVTMTNSQMTNAVTSTNK